MTKPPTSVRSIRLPDSLWADLNAWAKREDTSVNALVADVLFRALSDCPQPVRLSREQIDHLAAVMKPGAIVRVVDEAGPSFVPLLERKPFNPQPKTGKKR